MKESGGDAKEEGANEGGGHEGGMRAERVGSMKWR